MAFTSKRSLRCSSVTTAPKIAVAITSGTRKAIASVPLITASMKGRGANFRSKTRPRKAVPHERRQTSSVVHRPYGIVHKFFEHCFLEGFIFALPKYRTKNRADCGFRFRHKLLVGLINCVDALEFV